GSLAKPRNSPPTFAVGNTLYVVGGSGATIEAARINADGTLGTFAELSGVSLPIAQGGGSFTARGFAYIIGGSDTFARSTARLQRASLDASSGLGAFANDGSIHLPTTRNANAIALVGNTIYLLGGNDAAGRRLTTIERATVATDGTLQAVGTASISLPIA